MSDNMKHPTGEFAPVPHHHHHHVAPNCDDQIPGFSLMGRGPQGDSTLISMLEGRVDSHILMELFDGVTGEKKSEWISDNVNGGELRYQYNLNPHTIPRTFTITFVYTRGHKGDKNYANWSWTTPAIPYIWRLDNEDGSVSEQPDHIIGTGVATLFVKTMHSDWDERLNYPIDPVTGQPYDRDYFNAPGPDGNWASTITFGIGGDIEVPDIDDIARILGITKEDIKNLIKAPDNTFTVNGITAKNIIDYINKCDDRDFNHLHADLGFGHTGRGEHGKTFGPSPITGEKYNNVKEYIDAADKALKKKIDDAMSGIKQNIANLIYGATVDEDGNIVIPDGTMIPTGNINVLSDTRDNAILTHGDPDKLADVKAK